MELEKILNINKNTGNNLLIDYIQSVVSVPNNVKIVYQYTNIEALFNGIIVKNPILNKEICLWASNCEYMNDPDEVRTGRKFIDKAFKLSLDKKRVSSSENKKIEEAIKKDFFITSFSLSQDSLPMWKMYGRKGHGIALGFDKEILLNDFSDFMYRCIYVDNTHKNIVSQLLKEPISINENLNLTNKEDAIKMFGKLIIDIMENIITFSLVSVGAMFLVKNPYYKYEDEVRLLQIAKEKIEYRYQNNFIIPYIKNYFPKSVLKEIWIGPANSIDRTKKSLRIYLDANGFDNVKIISSKIPYRS
ncbi:DUF2971 domain-containing protein [Phocaeicola faecalis]|uniref:DUF2971 domain-containing protein n=1 Tax=Phocaeicola faecalis TaxID=2786956 RepID=UPI001F17C03E|nr:DUF2971 domain-containing protein [Phocaeicola faecalis]